MNIGGAIASPCVIFFFEGRNEIMNEYIKWMEKNPKLLKLVLCLPILDISWAIWRILKAIKHNNALELILGVLWIFFGGTVGWILDIICIALNDYPFWFK